MNMRYEIVMKKRKREQDILINIIRAKPIDPNTSGYRICVLRQRKGISQTELANLLDNTYVRIHEWETGVRNPSTEACKKIADVFGVDYRWIKYGYLEFEPITVMQDYIQNDPVISADPELFKQKKNILNSVVNKASYLNYENLQLLDSLLDHLLLNDSKSTKKVRVK